MGGGLDYVGIINVVYCLLPEFITKMHMIHLQHESFVFVKYVVFSFLENIFYKFKNLHPNITITKKYFRTDVAGQHFMQKYTSCLMTLMKEEIEWYFTAASHGKGDIH